MNAELEKGFTLIEVMISMFIMAMLTILVSTSIRTAVQNKQKLEARMAVDTELYDALRVIKLDVERAFHYQDVFFAIENLAMQQLDAEKRKTGQGGVDPNAQQRQPPVQLTQFKGNSGSMHFTALNHFRTQYNAQESDQMEVGYFVEGCDRRDGDGSTKCLWRRSNPMIDDEVDKEGPKVIVAYNVERFNLEYRSDLETDDWVKEWRSDGNGKASQQNKFPNFVKISLEIKDNKAKIPRSAKQTIVVQVAFPNNQPILQTGLNGQGGQGGQNGQQQGPGPQ